MTSGQSTQLTGTVRISATQTIAVHLLPPIIGGFREQQPGNAIEVSVSNALSNLLRREADVAIRMVRPAQSSLVARRIGDVRIGAYASADYVLRRGLPRTPAELARHDLIGLDRDDSILRSFAALGHRIERESFAVRSDDHLLIWEALRAGLGIGFAATWLADRERSLQRVLPDLPMPSLPVWLAVHREIRSSATIRVLYDYLAKAIPAAIG